MPLRPTPFATCLIPILLIGGSCLGLNASVVSAQDRPAFKSLPPEGIEVDPRVLAELRTAAAKARHQLRLAADASDDRDEWAPDVEVLIRGVELALEQNLFFKPQDTDLVARSLELAIRRLEAANQGVRGVALQAIGSRGKDAGRTIAGGFVSRIDGSVQPYGLVLPPDFNEVVDADPTGHQPWRLDVWLHGRGDTNTELPFLYDRLSKLGVHAPDKTIVLHPFGRHCNAFKFAGEVDVMEAIGHVANRLRIHPDRISIRGFSMGGAGCWHLAAHTPGIWFAANPGAGFVDTIRYQGWDKSGIPYDPGHWGRRLMRWYDVTDWVDNLRNTRVLAYSGEVDKQREAAELMVEAAREAGFEIPHVIGAGMGHKIDEDSARAIDDRLAKWSAEVSLGHRPRIDWTTYTLRYSGTDWLSVQGMRQHWERTTVQGELVPPATVRLTADGATRLRCDFTRWGWPLETGPTRLEINGQVFAGPDATRGEALVLDLIEQEGKWFELDESAGEAAPRKRPGLQGPIDDAFTGPFLFVLPSRPSRHGEVERFVTRELEHARRTWRRVMRGEDRVVMDHELTPEMIAGNHLICFGDPTSNRYLASIASRLPIRWDEERITVGSQTADATTHALLMVYPNPKNPDRYVVLNSGVTFREFSNSTNSRQIAMLPDWAIVDVTEPADGIYPGKIVAADFFDESWQVTPTAVPQTDSAD